MSRISRALVIAALIALPLQVTAAEARQDSKKEKSEPKGVLDKEVKVKGTGITIQFGGFAKVDLIQDFENGRECRPVQGELDPGRG